MKVFISSLIQGLEVTLGGALTRLAKKPDAHLPAVVLTHVERRVAGGRA